TVFALELGEELFNHILRNSVWIDRLFRVIFLDWETGGGAVHSGGRAKHEASNSSVPRGAQQLDTARYVGLKICSRIGYRFWHQMQRGKMHDGVGARVCYDFARDVGIAKIAFHELNLVRDRGSVTTKK